MQKINCAQIFKHRRSKKKKNCVVEDYRLFEGIFIFNLSLSMVMKSLTIKLIVTKKPEIFQTPAINEFVRKVRLNCMQSVWILHSLKTETVTQWQVSHKSISLKRSTCLFAPSRVKYYQNLERSSKGSLLDGELWPKLLSSNYSDHYRCEKMYLSYLSPLTSCFTSTSLSSCIQPFFRLIK